jgi:uncharacterized protein with NRDE domain
MCLAAIAIGLHDRYRWVLASNRDEYFDRPATPLAWWRPNGESHDILSGRDLSAGGTWLGLTSTGRMALATNVREPGRFLAASHSRGGLVVQSLLGRGTAGLAQLLQEPRNGFNLFTADVSLEVSGAADEPVAAWATNRPPRYQVLGPGLYGLSNSALDTPWPKVTMLKERLRLTISSAKDSTDIIESAFAALSDRQVAADANLPSTGVPLERERQLSPAFVDIGATDSAPRAFGTRCSTVVVVERSGGGRVVVVVERCFEAGGAPSTETIRRWDLPRDLGLAV